MDIRQNKNYGWQIDRQLKRIDNQQIGRQLKRIDSQQIGRPIDRKDGCLGDSQIVRKNEFLNFDRQISTKYGWFTDDCQKEWMFGRYIDNQKEWIDSQKGWIDSQTEKINSQKG